MVKYNCDAWGNHSACNPDGRVNNSEMFIGNINPFRYKGYYYDTDTQMYYCKSRYYVPEWCRWLNADHTSFLDHESVVGLNLFSYCQNNPIMYVDPSGYFWDTVFDLFVICWDIVNLSIDGGWKGIKCCMALWKTKKGYTVIDIGIDIGRVSNKTGKLIRSSSYIVEKIVLNIWRSRNYWKWIYHFYF